MTKQTKDRGGAGLSGAAALLLFWDGCAEASPMIDNPPPGLHSVYGLREIIKCTMRLYLSKSVILCYN